MSMGAVLGTGGGGAYRMSFSHVRVVQSQYEARKVVTAQLGSAAVVVRGGQTRSVLFTCPCGCGEMLVINADGAAGPAWRVRLDQRGLTLMPSVWRTTGCESHFIVWANRIWWCRYRSDGELLDDSEWPVEMDSELRDEWRRIRRSHRGT